MPRYYQYGGDPHDYESGWKGWPNPAVKAAKDGISGIADLHSGRRAFGATAVEYGLMRRLSGFGQTEILGVTIPKYALLAGAGLAAWYLLKKK